MIVNDYPLRLLCILILSCFMALTGTEVLCAAPKNIVLVAGEKSHGPEGNRIHDYPWSAKLLKVMLERSNVRGQVAVEFHRDGWPGDPTAFVDADLIMVISDGRDGHLYKEAPHLENEERVKFVREQVSRGCAVGTFHFSTFAPDQYGQEVLDWTGGYFDWETDGKRQWYSAIKTLDTTVKIENEAHPVSRGLSSFQMKEEFYYNIRFPKGGAGVVPVLSVPALPGREPDGKVVGWVRERKDGGRGFGTTCGHFYDNWRNDTFRKFVLNSMVWAAGVDVPAGGVESRFYTHAEITAALSAEEASNVGEESGSIKALILTGHQYPGHKWRETTPVIKGALEQDARFEVNVSTNIEDLASIDLSGYDTLVLNYCNWEQPGGLSDASKAAFVNYLKSGGGLTLVHFSNGAWHYSLPGAEASDWPEFRQICRRVWDHKSDSAHDAYGTFRVDVSEVRHEITKGMVAFDTIDELYFNQKGSKPIEPLLVAQSKKTGRSEPMAWAYSYGEGRVFQTVLGHAAESLAVGGAAQVLRRGAVWTANREQVHLGPRPIGVKR